MPGHPDDDPGRAGQAPGPAVAERGRRPDAPLGGDRGRGTAADLLRRLEGLPHGHPSSPYHDDGTAKPALTRLKDLELPLPPAGPVHAPPPVVETAATETVLGAGPGVRATGVQASGVGVREPGVREPGVPAREDPGMGAPVWGTDSGSDEGPGALGSGGVFPADEALVGGAPADEVSLAGIPVDEPAVYARPAPPVEPVAPESLVPESLVPELSAAPETVEPEMVEPERVELEAPSRPPYLFPLALGSDTAVDGPLEDPGPGPGPGEEIPDGIGRYSRALDGTSNGHARNGAPDSRPLDGALPAVIPDLGPPDGSAPHGSASHGGIPHGGAQDSGALDGDTSDDGAPDDRAPGDYVRGGGAPDGQVPREPGEQLTPDQVRIAVRAHGRCRLAEGRSVFGSYGEGGLTPAMRRIEDQLEHGELVPETEKYALKSLDRFQQKLAKLIAEEPGASPDSLAAQIHDGIRYTFLYEPDVYAQGVQATRSTLVAHGYELQSLRNSWESGEYKGINSRWRDPVSGTHFEIQFHTQQSWDSRIQAHDAYDLIASPLTTAAEKEQLRIRQRNFYSAVYPPPGCTGIADYRREG